jgi:hypothetical protein
VRRLTHRLRSTGQYHLRLPEYDLLRRLRHRLESGSAEPVDGHRWGLDGNAGTDPYVAGQVDGICGRLQNISEDYMVYRGGLYATAGDCCPGSDRAQVSGGKILEGAPERSESGASA